VGAELGLASLDESISTVTSLGSFCRFFAELTRHR
jgi:hypothetical protein